MNRGLLVVLSSSAGLAVANSYYNQPMLGRLAIEYGLTAALASAIPFLTQFGNAAGVLFIAPLGDRLERKRLILMTTAALVAALAAAAAAPTFLWLACASLLIGLFATVAQQIVPMSIHLAPAHAKGQVLGIVTGGILAGILLSRTLSGFVSEWWDWQAMFAIAAGLMAAVGLLLAWRLPRVAPSTDVGYFELLGSLRTLIRAHPGLRRSICIQALIFAAFLAFWSNLALLLAGEPFRLGASAVGSIALVGAAGALAAPIAGRYADRWGAAPVVTAGAGLVVGAFVLFGAFQGSLAILVLGVIAMDLGVQASQVANQARVYALDPSARSRLNTIFMATMLFGGACGAGIGGLAFSYFGWTGICAFGAVSATAALILARTS
jgi:predicted MFS family arabinose efflux permease